MRLLSKLDAFARSLDYNTISEDRKAAIQPFVDYVQAKKDKGEAINLNFICTHNSRRSQFSQIWGKVAAVYYGIEVSTFSGGVEVTAFNERAVASIQRFGFEVSKEGQENPQYSVSYAESQPPLVMFSKLYDDATTPDQFAAVMTCSHADENCPFIPAADARIPLRYEDPKAFDDTPKEAEMYDERSRQIATELFFAFSKIS